MDEKLGIDFIDQTIIDWNNMTNNKIEKINEELKQKGNYLLAEILKKIEENDKDVLISKMEQLADVETATIKGIIVKSKESTKEIIDTYILGIKKHLNAEAEKYGRDISSESITTKKINECTNKYIIQFDNLKKVYNDAILEQLYIKGELQKGIFNGIVIRIDNKDNEKVAEYEYIAQKQSLENEIKEIITINNKSQLQQKLEIYRRFTASNSLTTARIRDNYSKFEMKYIYQLIEQCEKNIESLEQNKELAINALIITKEQSLIENTKTIKFRFLEKIINKINGEKKFNKLALQPVLDKLEEISKKVMPTSMQNAIKMKEQYNQQIRAKIENSTFEIKNQTINYKDPIIQKIIENGANFEININQYLFQTVDKVYKIFY